MTTGMNHPLVSDYLARLDAAAAALPADRRDELVADIRAHLAAATAQGALADAEVRTMLDRLGSPEELVEAAYATAGYATAGYAAAGYAAPTPLPHSTPLPPVAPRSTTREVVALVLFALSGVLTVTLVGAPLAILTWIPALVLLLISSVWSAREKIVGALVLGLAGSPIAVLVVGAVSFLLPWSSEECSSGPVDAAGGTATGQGPVVCTGGPPAWLPWLAGAVALALVVGWLLTWFRLWRSARRGGG